MGFMDFFSCYLKSRAEGPVRAGPSCCFSDHALTRERTPGALPPPSQENHKYAQPSLRSRRTHVDLPYLVVECVRLVVVVS